MSVPIDGPRPLKVKVTVTVTLKDPADWTLAFGVEGRREIAKDVKSYIGNGVIDYGVFGDGEVDANITWE